MAKQPLASRLPSVEIKPGERHESKPGSVLKGCNPGTVGIVDGIETVQIELPIGPRSNGFLQYRVNAHLTTQVQQIAMQRLRNGLIESRAVLRDGTKVSNEQHAIRWLLESLPIE